MTREFGEMLPKLPRLMTQEEQASVFAQNTMPDARSSAPSTGNAGSAILSTATALLDVMSSTGSAVSTFNSTQGNPVDNTTEDNQRKARGRSVGNVISAVGAAVASLLATFCSAGAAAPLAVGAGSLLTKGITQLSTTRRNG